jgi:hypothetical protein
MPRTKANLKSRKANLRATAARTRKNTRHAVRMDRKERITQAAIAGNLILEQVAALQAAGVIPAAPVLPAPAAAAAAAAAPDPMEQLLDLDEAALVLHNAAEAAADPAPLHAQIDLQVANVVRNRCIVKYSVRKLIHIFMTLVLTYYASFPIHADPFEKSLFDEAASHLSLAGTVTGKMALPGSGILTFCAAGFKVAGYGVREHNARTGRFMNLPGNAYRRKLNYLEYDPTLGTAASIARVAGLAGSAAIDMSTGTPVSIVKIGTALFTDSLADVITEVAVKKGKDPVNALRTAVKTFGV